MPATDKILFYMFGRENPRVVRADGYYYYDTRGNQYLDGTSSAFNCVLGHSMPKGVQDVFRRQTERLNFATLAYFQNDAADRLADRLLTMMPDYAALGLYQSGSDAVEAAMRCALQVSRIQGRDRRTKIIGRRGGYHGPTLGTLALSGSGSIRGEDFPTFIHLESLDCFACPFGAVYPTCEVKCASMLRQLVEKEDPETIAAFIAEPSSKGGPVPDEYWPQIREICDEYGILLVSDEILEGLGRTGPTVALNRWGVVPDLVATGKVLGAGYMPIFAMLVTEEVRNILAQGGASVNGHCFSGHILSCEVAHAVLDEIESRQLAPQGIVAIERQLTEVLTRVCARFEGTRMAVLGALARLSIRKELTEGYEAAYLRTQGLLQSCGLLLFIRVLAKDRIELAVAPPFTADHEFFDQLEKRLVRFLERIHPDFEARREGLSGWS